MAPMKSALRQEFERGRRREAFFAFLAAAGAGIIATDTWISPWLGAAGGLIAGGLAYASVYAYETIMWKRHHG